MSNTGWVLRRGLDIVITRQLFLAQVVNTFPPETGREFILRSVLPSPGVTSCPCPQRMFCVLTKDQFRLAGAFSNDITSSWWHWGHFFFWMTLHHHDIGTFYDVTTQCIIPSERWIWGLVYYLLIPVNFYSTPVDLLSAHNSSYQMLPCLWLE